MEKSNGGWMDFFSLNRTFSVPMSVEDKVYYLVVVPRNKEDGL
jgi:hypothetical protein